MDVSNSVKYQSMNEPTSLFSENSFVILGQGSIPYDEFSHIDVNSSPNSVLENHRFKDDVSEKSSLISNQNISMKGILNSHPSVNNSVLLSLDAEANTESIQKMLDNLLKENFQLKETLKQNNIAMKQQFETLVVWQEEIFKTHQTHKQKFSETKELVLKLKAENAFLRRQYESGSSDSDLSILKSLEFERENSSLKKIIDDLQDRISSMSMIKPSVSKKEEELNNMVGDLLQKLEKSEKNNRQLASDLAYFNEQLTDREQKLLQVTGELNIVKNELRQWMEKSEKSISKSTDNSMGNNMQNAEYRAQIQTLIQELEFEKLNISTLQTELETKRNTIKSLETRATEIDNSKNLNDRNDMEKNVEVEKIVNERVKLLNEEILSLQKSFNTERAVYEREKESLELLQKQYTKLYMDFKQIQQECIDKENMLKKQKTEDNQSDVKLQTYVKTIDNLRAQLKEKDVLLNEACNNIGILKGEVKKLNLVAEHVEVLKAQVETYKTDFNDERTAREKLAEDKENVSRDLRLLQTENKKLKEDLELYNLLKFDDHGQVSQPTSSRENQLQPNPRVMQEVLVPAAPSAPATQIPNKVWYKCPVDRCIHTYDDPEKLNRHVNECLDTYMYP